MTVEQDIENNRRHLDKNYFGVLGFGNQNPAQTNIEKPNRPTESQQRPEPNTDTDTKPQN